MIGVTIPLQHVESQIAVILAGGIRLFRHFVSSMPAPVTSGWSESQGVA
jgi:hypothetical protein